MRTTIVLSILALTSVAHAEAHAEEEVPLPELTADAGAATTANASTPGERLVMPAKRGLLHVNIELNLSKDSAGDPISLAPDLWYGINDKLTVGLAHSSMAKTGFMGGVGDSLCLVGDLCDGVYSGVGIDGRYQLATGKLGAALNLGLYANDFDPFQLALKLGVVGRYRSSPDSKLALDFAPSLFFGITEREPSAMGATGNKETLLIPVTVHYALGDALSAALQTGIALPFEKAGDVFSVPLSLGINYQVNRQASIDAAFSLPILLGGSALPTGVDVRTITIGGGYAF